MNVFNCTTSARMDNNFKKMSDGRLSLSNPQNSFHMVFVQSSNRYFVIAD
jgi:hypothetical protein